MRYILNILVAHLTSEPVKSVLLKMYNLEKLPDWLSYSSLMMHVQGYEIMYYIVWMVVPDQASYMFSEFFNLNQICINLRDVTCIVHALHCVYKSVRMEYSKIKEFIS